jgi:hypothetical protein
VLRVVSGNYTISQSNVTVSGLDIQGKLDITGSGVTVVNSRVRCINENDWCVTLLGNNDVLSHVDIGGQADGHTYGHGIGVWSGNPGSQLLNLNVHHTIHGMRVDGNTLVADSWIHELPMGDPPYQTDHTDGSMTTGGANITFRHNRIEGGNTAPLFFQYSSGNDPISNVSIVNNLILNVAKNGEVSSYGIGVGSAGTTGYFGVTNNVFGYGWQVGPISSSYSGLTKSGNTYTDGKPI